MFRLIDTLSDRWHVAAREAKLRDFLRLCHPTSGESVLDVGVLGAEEYEAANFFLKVYPHPERLTALSIEGCDDLRRRYPLVRFVTYDGWRFPFPDKSFDICHSNAVVEHVGDAERQRLFVSEMVRVARSGFFTTPNRWFPLELHTKMPFLHYLPRRVYLKSCRVFGDDTVVSGIHLLDYRQLASLIEGASVLRHQILKNRVLGMTATFSVYWCKSEIARGPSGGTYE